MGFVTAPLCYDNLRRTIEAIVWRHKNGAKWRSIPPHLGPWWMAAQTFIRWSRHDVWERLLGRAQRRRLGKRAWYVGKTP